MKQRKSFITYFALFCALLLSSIASAQAATLTVDSNADQHDKTPGDGLCYTVNQVCTLRAAIEEANAFPGADTIEFAAAFYAPNAPRTIALSLNELLVSSNLTINGPGARQLTVDGAQKDRVMRFVSLPGNPKNTVIVSGLTMQNGKPAAQSSSDGGGVYVDRTNLTLKAVTVRNNKAHWTIAGQPGKSAGGGIFSYMSQLTIVDSTISHNEAYQQGGGINSRDGDGLFIYNSTISLNSAMMGGGGIYQTDNGVIKNTTIAQNGGWQNAGGGIWFQNADPQNGYNYVGNSIVANNAAAVTWDLCGKFNSLGNNLVKFRGASTGYIASDLPDGADPKLGSLKNNGGQTDTYNLLAGSAAIDAGNDCLVLGDPCRGKFLYDQRGFGFTRKSGSAVDIGAYEYAKILLPKAPIRGKVMLTDGGGVPSVFVSMTAEDGTFRMVETDSKGRFSFDDVETGKAYVLKVENSAQAAYEPQTIVVTEARDNVNLVPVADAPAIPQQ